MSKKCYLLLAKAFTFCMFNHHMYGCPICVDAIGSIKKPFFIEEGGEKIGQQKLSLHKKCFLKSEKIL